MSHVAHSGLLLQAVSKEAHSAAHVFPAPWPELKMPATVSKPHFLQPSHAEGEGATAGEGARVGARVGDTPAGGREADAAAGGARVAATGGASVADATGGAGSEQESCLLA